MRRKHVRLINNDDVSFSARDVSRRALDGVMGPNIPSPNPKRRKKGVYCSASFRAGRSLVSRHSMYDVRTMGSEETSLSNWNKPGYEKQCASEVRLRQMGLETTKDREVLLEHPLA